jgi:acetyl-CoA synthetase
MTDAELTAAASGAVTAPDAAGRERAEARAQAMFDRWGGGELALAAALVDGHPPDDVAYTFVEADMTLADLTYGELRERSERFAAALADLGVGPGDRVATLMAKSVDLVTALVGIWRRGAVHVPLFTAFAPPAVALRLDGSGAKVVVADDDQRAKLPDDGDAAMIVSGGARPRPGDLSFDEILMQHQPGIAAETVAPRAPFLLIFTSGTTGTPKGVPIPVSGIGGIESYLVHGYDLRPEDVYWNIADPGWAYGLYYAIVGPLATGHRGILARAGFSAPATYRILADLGVTNFAGAPTIYRALRNDATPAPDDLRLRCLSSAGEPLNPDVIAWAEETLGVPIRDHYGQTELAMVTGNAWHPDLLAPLKPGSMGRTLPGWSVAVLDTEADEVAPDGTFGRLAIDPAKSPAMPFFGYHDAPERTAERMSGDGRWYVTGDVARRDEDGYFHFASRDDDVIIMAGYRIGPFEVESALVEHPDVAEAAVIGAPDELRGEVVEAYVVLREGREGSDALAEELKQQVKTGFAAHAYPRRVHFVDALPKTPSGKIQRYVLRDRRAAEPDG